jgi:hypothetical protein
MKGSEIVFHQDNKEKILKGIKINKIELKILIYFFMEMSGR